MSRRDAKGSLRLVALGRHYQAEARVRVDGRGILLELHRDDAKGGPAMTLALDEAQAFLRAVQGAVDEAYRRAKAASQVRDDCDLNLSEGA